MKTFTRIMWLLSGILLIAAGIVCLCNPGATILSLAYVLGAFTLVSGIFSLVSYFQFGVGMLGGGWMFADGIITVLLGIVLLANDVVVATVLPFVFGMWILFSGISRFILAFDLKRANAQRWWVVLIEAVLCVVLGILSFFRPVFSAVAISILVGIYLIVTGISTLSDWFFVHRVRNYFKELKKKLEAEARIIDAEAEDADAPEERRKLDK